MKKNVPKTAPSRIINLFQFQNIQSASETLVEKIFAKRNMSMETMILENPAAGAEEKNFAKEKKLSILGFLAIWGYQFFNARRTVRYKNTKYFLWEM